jgi:hypothetical protein
MDLTVYYRISDKGRPKTKLPNASKMACLRNCIAEFGASSVRVIADNCTEATVAEIRSLGLEVEETSLGNSGSFVHMADRIIRDRAADDLVYLLEDDYLHRPGSRKLLLEGLAIADYVTLYDHPDKYVPARDGGNPFNRPDLEPSRVYATGSVHWRTTNSTTMTFACRVRLLAEDYPIWKESCSGGTPNDFYAFLMLGGRAWRGMLYFLRKGERRRALRCVKHLPRGRARKIVSSVPAYSTHTEEKALAPCFDWSSL